MGLLDYMNSDDGRMTMSLLAAAGPQTDPNKTGFGQRMMQAQSSIDAYKQQQAEQKRAQMQEQMQMMQMQEYQRKMQQEQKQEAAMAQKQAALPGLFRAASNGAPALSIDSLLPTEMRAGTMPQAAIAPQQGGIDVQAALRANYTAKEIQELDALRNIGLNKVARTMKGMQNGREVDQQLDDYGRPVGQGMEQFRAPIMQDLGGNVSALDPYTLQPKATFGKTMTFADRNAAGNLSIAQQRFALDKQGGAEGGKPQLVDGQWVYKPDAQNPQGRVVPVQGMADKPLNDSQGKANLFGNRMIEAENILKEVADKADRPGWIKRTTQATVGLVPFAGDKLSEVAGSALNFTQSSPQQQVEQAKQNFINALLRRESGAVIGRDEFTSADNQYFPQIGDSAERIAQKQRNRETAIKGVMAEVPRSRNTQQSGATSTKIRKFNLDGTEIKD